MPHPDDRWSFADGAHNVRDLGGVPCRLDASVRRGRVFRGGFPAFASVRLDQSPGGRRSLRTVVDLRGEDELHAESINWEGAGVSHLRCVMSAGVRDSWHMTYDAYLRHSPEAVVSAIEFVMDEERHPVLFHCAAGKDRTGIVAALLLRLLHVSDEHIVADYVLTESALAPVLERLASVPLYALRLEGTTLSDQLPSAKTMEAFLRWVDEQGGAESWVLDHGLAPDLLRGFRRAMLV